MLDRKAISQARYGLGNPRETNAFAIENRAEKWSIATVQMGNNFAHTVRDKSLDQLAEKHEIPDAWIEICEMAASPSKMTWARGVTWI